MTQPVYENLPQGLPVPQPEDWSKLAGYIDGEGCICIRRTGRVLNMRLAVANTDPRMLYWILDTFGVGTVTIRHWNKNRDCRPLYTWEICGRRAEYVLFGCIPYLSIKQEQADIAMAFQKLVGFRGIGRSRKLPSRIIEARKYLAGELQKEKAKVYTLREVQ